MFKINFVSIGKIDLKIDLKIFNVFQKMEPRFKIEFGDHRHRRTGFLANAARYSFVLDNKEWPSVEHYVCSQAFKGTPFEEQLRCAPSPWHLRFLVRGKKTSCEKNGRLIKIYSKPSSQKTHHWYQKSIPNKFFQNQIIMGRLLNTGNSRLVDVTCPYTGPILEKIRTQCYQERFQKNFMYSKQNLETSPDVKDVFNSSLTIEDYAIINGLINKAWENVKKTDQKCIYIEFLENTLLELYPKRAEFIIMLYQMRTPQMISQMPHFSNIINQVYEIFRKQDPYQEYDLSGSYLISEILRWLKMYASPAEASQFLRIVTPNFIKPTTEDFKLPPASYSNFSHNQNPSIKKLLAALQTQGKPGGITSVVLPHQDDPQVESKSSEIINTLKPAVLSSLVESLDESKSSGIINTLKPAVLSSLDDPLDESKSSGIISALKPDVLPPQDESLVAALQTQGGKSSGIISALNTN